MLIIYTDFVESLYCDLGRISTFFGLAIAGKSLSIAGPNIFAGIFSGEQYFQC